MMKIDGVEVDDDYVLDREKFLKIKMPNRDGFVPKIDGPNGPENVRKFYANPANFGAQKVNPAERCMYDCQEKSVKIACIQHGGISDFLPPMAVAKDLPKPKDTDMGFNVKKSYQDNCMPCHGAEGMGAPVVGNKAEWTDYISEGMATVYKKGISGMPPKGGASVSDTNFKSLVDYMVNQSK